MIKAMLRRNAKGFALVEIVIVIIFVVLFAAVVTYSFNAQPKDTSNTQRRADVNAILRALEQYAQKHGGAWPAGITTVPKLIASTPGDAAVDLCRTLAPEFLETIPLDPTAGLAVPVGKPCAEQGVRYSSGYMVHMGADKRVTVSAPAAQNSESIFAHN